MDDEVVLPPEMLEVVEELRAVRSDAADLARRAKDLRAELLQSLSNVMESDKPRGITASGKTVVRIRKQRRRSIDRDQLEALYPDVYDEVMTETETIIVDLP